VRDHRLARKQNGTEHKPGGEYPEQREANIIARRADRPHLLGQEFVVAPVHCQPPR
jgi:hypothetical protein